MWGLFVTGIILGSNGTVQSKNLVYQVCQQARVSNRINDATCGDLQDYLGIEYLCNNTNSLSNNKCWVEIK